MDGQDEDEQREESAGGDEDAHENEGNPRMLGAGVGSVRKGKGVRVKEEREVQHEPQVLVGDDDVPRQPTSQRDPFVPEPGPRPGERRAWRVMRLAWIPLVIAIAVVLWAALR